MKFMSPGTDGRGDITEVLITSPRGINPELKPPMDGKGGEWDQTVGLHKQVYLPPTIPLTTCIDSIIMQLMSISIDTLS